MKDLFFDYVLQPSLEKFLSLRRKIIDNQEFDPYSRELAEMVKAYKEGDFPKVLGIYKASFHNLVLSPMTHKILQEIGDLIGEKKVVDFEATAYQRCLEGILRSGEGTKESPYQVCRTSDEYDVLFSLGIKNRKQRLEKYGEKMLDIFDIEDGGQIVFDVTEVYPKVWKQFEVRQDGESHFIAKCDEEKKPTLDAESQETLWNELNAKAATLCQQGLYSEAVKVSEEALTVALKSFGPNHPDAAVSMNNLAFLYHVQGKYGEAEPLYKRSLEISEKALGKDHPDAAVSMNNLAELYRDQGKYGEAEPLLKRSLEICEKALGKDHPDAARSLNNLAVLYQDQGKYAEAEPLLKRSLKIKEKALGKNHPHVATSLNNLAELYRAQGKYAEAEPLYKRSLEIREKALGKDHPDAAVSMNNLAFLYHAQGKYGEAEPLYKRSLEIREKALGKDHPHVATVLENMAKCCQEMGKENEAKKFEARAKKIRSNR